MIEKLLDFVCFPHSVNHLLAFLHLWSRVRKLVLLACRQLTLCVAIVAAFAFRFDRAFA